MSRNPTVRTAAPGRATAVTVFVVPKSMPIEISRAIISVPFGREGDLIYSDALGVARLFFSPNLTALRGLQQSLVAAVRSRKTISRFVGASARLHVRHVFRKRVRPKAADHTPVEDAEIW